ncbi:MAG: patatin-like phospholipase family protein [Gammaproteobacteria bacterium]|nr:patatin-like phospholipase family protein [Gammaproteobacteria bacterium]
MQKKTINLALQGGGAHGAFTWGVLDYLLQDGRLEVEAVSGTSAGALNAVALADGLMRGGADGARERLQDLWHAISDVANWSPVQRSTFDVFMGNWSLDYSPGFWWSEMMSRMTSPYFFNPLDYNPLRDIVERHVDFDRVRGCDQLKLFISATNVETGRVKVFDHNELTLDMVMASACLPMIFKAVEIDGVPYWDGGYMGNPSLFPFNRETESADVLIVQINPVERKGTPVTAQEIMNRINEITFNASLLRELRAIDFVRRLVDGGKLDENEYRKLRVHMIGNHEHLNPLGATSKLNAEWQFLEHLRDIGRDTAQAWMDRNHDRIGRESTVDLRAMFQGTGADDP